MTTSTAQGVGKTVRRAVVATPVVLVALWMAWATGLISIKFGLQRADPMAFAVLRVAITTLLLGVAMMIRSPSPGERANRGQFHRWALVVGLAQIAVFFIAQNLGMADADAGLSAVLLYTQPFMVAIAARALLGEQLTPRQVTGMALGWCGVAALVWGETSAGSTPLSAMLFLLLAAVAWAVSTILFKRMPSFPLVPLLFWMNIYAIFPMIPFVFWTNSTVTWGLHLVVATIYAGAFAGIGGMGLSFVLLRRGAASVVSSWIFAVPVLTALLSVPLLGERLDTRLLAAGSLVAVGIALVNWNIHRRPSADPVTGVAVIEERDPHE